MMPDQQPESKPSKFVWNRFRTPYPCEILPEERTAREDRAKKMAKTVEGQFVLAILDEEI